LRPGPWKAGLARWEVTPEVVAGRLPRAWFFLGRPLFKTQAFQTIADKVRRNTERVLKVAKDGNLLPRAAAEALAERRLRRAMAFRRWS